MELDEKTLDTMNALTDKPAQSAKPVNGSAVSLDDPSLNTVADDDIGSIDWDAPESRSNSGYTPQVYPGIHNFLFALEDDKPFETREYDTKDGQHIKDFTVNHKGTVSYVTPDGEQKESTIRFNQAGFSRTAKMKEKKINSAGGELLRSLGIHAETKAAVEQALREADGKVMGRGVVNWSAYCKSCNQGVTTNGRLRSNEVRWPKGVDGKYVTDVVCPKCGSALAGREKITDYKLPQV